RRHAECPTCLLPPERRLVAHGPVPHTNDPQAERVQAAGPDHLRRRRLYPEQRCRPDVPRVPPGVRALPDPGCPTLRRTGRAGAGSAVNPGHAWSGKQAGLMLAASKPSPFGSRWQTARPGRPANAPSARFLPWHIICIHFLHRSLILLGWNIRMHGDTSRGLEVERKFLVPKKPAFLKDC